MADYKERIKIAKEYLYKRIKLGGLTKEDAIKNAEKFYEYNKKEFIDEPIEYFIYHMERFDRTTIVYDRKSTWYEYDNTDYNEAFEEKLFSLIKFGLEKASPDFCEYTVSTKKRPDPIVSTVKDRYFIIVMTIKE